MFSTSASFSENRNYTYAAVIDFKGFNLNICISPLSYSFNVITEDLRGVKLRVFPLLISVL